MAIRSNELTCSNGPIDGRFVKLRFHLVADRLDFGGTGGTDVVKVQKAYLPW